MGAVPIQTTTQVDLVILVPVDWPLTAAAVQGLESVLILREESYLFTVVFYFKAYEELQREFHTARD